MSVNKFLIEGLDFTGKSSLVAGIQKERGPHLIHHFSKPIALPCYKESLLEYQKHAFRNMFSVLRDATYSHCIFDRSHIGECVYGPLYRNYDSKYVFSMERDFCMGSNRSTMLVLLTEDFDRAEHFVDDGDSFDPTKRKAEQELFFAAFEKSIIPKKHVICVTDKTTGMFRAKEDILQEVLSKV